MPLFPLPWTICRKWKTGTTKRGVETCVDFQNVKDLMDRAVAEHGVPFSEIAVSYGGEPVFRYRNGSPLENGLYYLYSATKPISATAVLQLYERGLVDLDGDVALYLPEFSNPRVKTEAGSRPAARPITIRNLLTMSSGLNYNCNAPALVRQLARDPNSSTRALIGALAEEPLEFDPGDHYLYSLSHDVLGAVVEVVSGMSLGEYLQKYIFAPCGMTRTGFAMPEPEKLNDQYCFDPRTGKSHLVEKKNSFVLSPDYQSGGAGLISCVDDYFAFVTEMANGTKLLRRETRDLMRTNQLRGQAWVDFQGGKPGYGYGLGVRTAMGTALLNQGEFGWDGAAGAYCLIDPDRNVAIFYGTHVLSHGEYLYKQLHPAIRDAVYQTIDR